MKSLFIAILSFFGLYTPVSPGANIISPSPAQVVSVLPSMVPVEKPDFVLPTPDFFSRITKKPFGLNVTPNSSPVSPEKFSGFHTGVDIEYEDIKTDVSVNAIYSGKIIYSGFVSGYGGVIIQSIKYKNSDFTVIYGHLNPASLITSGTEVSAGQRVGILGKGYTRQTDGERRHLHLAISRGAKINFKGYVTKESQLSSWINPVALLNSR